MARVLGYGGRAMTLKSDVKGNFLDVCICFKYMYGGDESVRRDQLE